MPGFSAGQEEFDRIFITEEELVNQYFGSTLFSWGSNTSGQLGQNVITSVSRLSPVLISGGGNTWKVINSAGQFAVGIKTDGTLWTWGDNSSGQLGNNGSLAVSRSSPQTTIAGENSWKSVAAGGGTVLAIKTDTTMWSWGNNSVGTLGTGDTIMHSSPVSVTGGWTGWKQVSLGGIGNPHALSIKNDGTLWTWGYNFSGELGNGTTESRSSPETTAGGGNNWKMISAGYQLSSAIKSDGTLWTWGSADRGALGNNSVLADRSSPRTTAGGGTNWKMISISSSTPTVAAIKTDGTLWTWGDGYKGVLGNNSVTSRSSPQTTVAGGTNWKFVKTSSNSTFAITTNGILWAWGDNGAGALGGNIVETLSRSSPQTITSGNQRWRSVSAGGTGGLSKHTGVFALSEDSFSE